MHDMAAYLAELDAKSQDYAVRVQIACAQAIVEAINRQTVVLEMLSTRLTLPRVGGGSALLSREGFLRRLHSLADSPRSTESISDDEVALSAHDAAMRKVSLVRLDGDGRDGFNGGGPFEE